jgi:hypothetical protein
MKRRVLTILLFLLLGAIANVAVAWVVILSPLGKWSSDYEDGYTLPGWCEGSSTDIDHTHEIGGFDLGGFGFDIIYVAGRPRHGDPSSVVAHSRFLSSGWPFRAFGQAYHTSVTVGRRVELVWRSQWSLELKKRSPKDSPPPVGGSVPLRPIWPGFAVNTVLYAIILWLLICGPFIARRLIRIKRGRCPKCGYDLRGQPPEDGAGAGRCPECGWGRQAASKAPGAENGSACEV